MNTNPCRKSFGFIHKCGILMPVSSLPSPYGIGSFGKAAFDFVDFLESCGQRVWQVLPLNPTSYGDSPYQSPASVAGNPYFIDLDLLYEQELLTREELCEMKRPVDRVDYGWLFQSRYPLLRRAYARFVPDRAFGAFCQKNADWLEDYALFMSLKEHYNHAAWTSWREEHRDIRGAREHAGDFGEQAGFWKWVQFEFMKEWQAVHTYAKEKGIAIIGDMPIYVAHDSMDVWRAPEQFLLDENYNPTVVAGCPPDAYSETGQLWGNPIYNWEGMARDGYAWWIDRVGHSFAMYDLLRIDHFRGFAGYYTIPAGDSDARGGRWNVGPGVALFDAIKQVYPKGKIIAEDLGFITDDVRELLRATDFPGMKVLQFAYYNDDSEYLPRTYATDNCIVYTSTHDSDCTRTWYQTLNKDEKERFARECKRAKGQCVVDAMIEAAMCSRANLCVICMQDYLHLNSEEGRMNVPSVAMNNWTWRISPRYATAALRTRIRTLCARGGRLCAKKDAD